jgi:hypothetical protein
MFRGMRRWSLLTVCVVADSRINANAVTGPEVPTVSVVALPSVALLGAEVMTGRTAALPSAFNR